MLTEEDTAAMEASINVVDPFTMRAANSILCPKCIISSEEVSSSSIEFKCVAGKYVSKRWMYE